MRAFDTWPEGGCAIGFTLQEVEEVDLLAFTMNLVNEKCQAVIDRDHDCWKEGNSLWWNVITAFRALSQAAYRCTLYITT
jgi:hypothetical protein